MTMIIEKGQKWISEEFSERSVFIKSVGNLYEEENDSSRYVIWDILDEEKWEQFVCKKLKVESIDQAIKTRNCGTYPYSFGGEMTFKSFKNYIRKWKLELNNK